MFRLVGLEFSSQARRQCSNQVRYRMSEARTKVTSASVDKNVAGKHEEIWEAKSFSTSLLKSMGAIGLSMAVGDGLCQFFEHKHWADMERTKTMWFIGTFITSPISFTWQMFLESRIPGPGRIITKIVANSVFAFIVSIPVVFTATTLLGKGPEGEKRNLNDAVEKIKHDLVPTFAAGCLYWPVFNWICFRFVPTPQRAIFNSLIGTVWQIFLSYKAHSDIVVADNEENVL